MIPAEVNVTMPLPPTAIDTLPLDETTLTLLLPLCICVASIPVNWLPLPIKNEAVMLPEALKLVGLNVPAVKVPEAMTLLPVMLPVADMPVVPSRVNDMLLSFYAIFSCGRIAMHPNTHTGSMHPAL